MERRARIHVEGYAGKPDAALPPVGKPLEGFDFQTFHRELPAGNRPAGACVVPTINHQENPMKGALAWLIGIPIPIIIILYLLDVF